MPSPNSPARGLTGPPPVTQCADAVLMVRPAAFGWNPQTAVTNRFQVPPPVCRTAAVAGARRVRPARVARLPRRESRSTRSPTVTSPPVRTRVFPNNWVSLHADGTVVLYPMLAPNRRLERRPELLAELAQRGGFRVERLLDLTHHELAGALPRGYRQRRVRPSVPRRLCLPVAAQQRRVLRELCEETRLRARRCSMRRARAARPSTTRT